jgi:hypothetical protein
MEENYDSEQFLFAEELSLVMEESLRISEKMDEECDSKEETNYMMNVFSKELIAKKTHNMQNNIAENDKVILPYRFFERITKCDIKNYFVQITNKETKVETYACIYDYHGQENDIYIPNYYFEKLEINDGTRVYVDMINVPKAKYAKFKIPEGMNMVENYLTIIEFILQQHKLLWNGKKIFCKMFNKTFAFEVVEILPKTCKVVNIIDSDLEIDIV